MSSAYVLISYWVAGKRLHLCLVVIVAPSAIVQNCAVVQLQCSACSQTAAWLFSQLLAIPTFDPDVDPCLSPQPSDEASPGPDPDSSKSVAPQGQTPLPRPQLMHSNLSSVDEVIAMSKLPDTTRPAILAFGTLADGFLPFNAPSTSDNHADGAAFFLLPIIPAACHACW